LELKLKQFAEVETLLLKECEQVERVRQRISAERVRMRSALLGPTGSGLPGGSSTMPSNPAGMSPRPVQGRCKILAPVKINLYFEHDLISYVSLSTFFIESSKGAC